MDAEVITIFYSNLVETASTDSVNLIFEWIIDNIYLVLGISFILVFIVWTCYQCYSKTNKAIAFFWFFCLNIWFVVWWFFMGIFLLVFIISDLCTNPLKLFFDFYWFFIPLGFILYWFAKFNTSTLGWILFFVAFIMVLPFFFEQSTDGNEVENDEENEDGDSIILVILE